MAKPDDEKPGIEAINKLKSTDPPLFLSPSSDLSCFSRLASQHLFASLKPYSPKSPFDHLLSDGFDAEQVWQQIDLQYQPLITSLKREIKRYEKNPDQILDQFGVSGANGVLEREIKENGDVGLEEDSEEFEELSDEDEDEDEEEEDDESEDGESSDEDTDEDDDDVEMEAVNGDGKSRQVGEAVALIKGEGKNLRRKEKRARIEQIRASLGLSDSMRTPVPGESLRDFYKRTSMYWQMAAYEHTQHTGKELRKDGFDFAEARYRELKPLLDELAVLEEEQKAEEQEVAETSSKRVGNKKNRHSSSQR